MPDPGEAGGVTDLTSPDEVSVFENEVSPLHEKVTSPPAESVQLAKGDQAGVLHVLQVLPTHLVEHLPALELRAVA